MTATIDLFYSFRSPYSYLATQGATQLEKDYDAKIHFRPVLPLALRDPSFFNPKNLKRVKYIMLDWHRRAEMLGMKHAWPKPDPIVQDLETYTIAEEQPYIYDLSYLGIAAEKEGKGLAFATEVSALIFSGNVWNEGDHLKEAVARAGFDLDALLADIAANPEEYQNILEQNQADQSGCGHDGVPTFVYDGDPYFGQDRIETLCWKLERDGLKK